MAHELEILSDGTASMVSAREIPWHRLGEVADHLLTVDEALKLSRADYEVIKVPVCGEVPGEDEGETRWLSLSNYRATVRENPEAPGKYIPLGIVGKDYQVVQNRDAFSFLDDLPRLHPEIVGDDVPLIETMGVLQNGRRAFATLKLPREIKVAEDDRMDLYATVLTGHDGTLALTGVISPIRVVCKNTASAALSTAVRTWKLHHTLNISGRLSEARRVLELTYRYADEFEEEAKAFLATSLSPKAQREILISLWPTNSETAEVSKRHTEERIDQVLSLAQADPADGTAWGLWNGVTEYIDWYRPTRARGGDKERASLSKAASVAWGPLADVKAAAFSHIRQMAVV